MFRGWNVRAVMLLYSGFADAAFFSKKGVTLLLEGKHAKHLAQEVLVTWIIIIKKSTKERRPNLDDPTLTEGEVR
jgi:hypothetical protein